MAGNGKTCYFPDVGAGGWQTTEKSTMKRECLVLGMNIPFSKYYGIKGLVMDKRRAIQIMTKAAEIYRDNLEDQKVLFLYGLPSDVKK